MTRERRPRDRHAEQLRAARRRPVLHPPTGAPADRVAATLDARLGHLLGTGLDPRVHHGVAELVALAPGRATRRAAARTLGGFLAEHVARTADLGVGRVRGTAGERRVVADAVLVGLLLDVAAGVPSATSQLGGPVLAGLDDERLHAVVDPRLVDDVTRLTTAAERTLWRPLATADVARVGAGSWRLGDLTVTVDLRAGRRLRSTPSPTVAPGTGRATWLGRHEALVVHEASTGRVRARG